MTSMQKIDPLAREIEMALCPGCFGKTDIVTPPFPIKSLRQFAPHFSCDKWRFLAAMRKVTEFQPYRLQRVAAIRNNVQV